jgi:predicted dehydrogenase/threonine dehydrogenase-like Zn-dependent dehydrogenase
VKQVVASRAGVQVVEVPSPCVDDKSILVRVEHTCISVGTELAGIRGAKESLYHRALKNPGMIKRGVDALRQEGWASTFARIARSRQGSPLGYSASGVVIACGRDVTWFMTGNHVACAGAGIANHAEIISVPVNLAVRVPDSVDLQSASTVALGAIALQGIRRAAPALGETVLVVGLGILGQLAVQLLKRNGCRVLGADPRSDRRRLASEAGMDLALDPGSEDYVETVFRNTEDFGADVVLVMAATVNSGVINDAIRACRRKGRVVIVGDVGLEIDRADLYSREVDLLISVSYGPGRYDEDYELEGRDYPFSYVRWTENRNMAAYLQLLAEGGVQVSRLPKETFAIDQAQAAYSRIQSQKSDALLFFLGYPERREALSSRVRVSSAALRDRMNVALVGAGAFAQSMHLPILRRARDRYAIRAIVARDGNAARVLAQRYESEYACTDMAEVLQDPAVDLVLIATRHDSHARLALQALQAGKHVFVEKPLAMDAAGLDAIGNFLDARTDTPILMTGFNRRFSPAVAAVKQVLADRRSPVIISYTVNAGYLPSTHWVHGPQGGGRNVGEACHFYDLFDFLTERQATFVSAQGRNDNFVATLSYADGSICVLTYSAMGHPDYPKERIELFADGTVIVLDDYKLVTVTGRTGACWRSRHPDKGHSQQFEALAEGIRAGTWPVPLQDQLSATRISLAVEAQLHSAPSVGDFLRRGTTL